MSFKIPNIIFLDMDGVLCNPRACLAVRNTSLYSYLDPIACQLVLRLCEDNNAKIVISSAWRLDSNLHSFQSILNAACPRLGEYIWNSQTHWRTTSAVFNNDISYTACRGDEIQDWINNHEVNFDRFVILDDNSDMGDLMEFLVQTDAYDGIGFNDYMKAEAILNGRSVQDL